MEAAAIYEGVLLLLTATTVKQMAVDEWILMNSWRAAPGRWAHKLVNRSGAAAARISVDSWQLQTPYAIAEGELELKAAKQLIVFDFGLLCALLRLPAEPSEGGAPVRPRPQVALCSLAQTPARPHIERSKDPSVRRPAVSGVRRPAVSGVRRPTDADFRRPEISDVRRPAESDVRRPEESDVRRPAESSVRRPAESGDRRPAESGATANTARETVSAVWEAVSAVREVGVPRKVEVGDVVELRPPNPGVKIEKRAKT